jgi:hypothetical protein
MMKKSMQLATHEVREAIPGDAFPKESFGSAEDTKSLRNYDERLLSPISSTVEIAICLELLRAFVAHKSVFRQPARAKWVLIFLLRIE